MKRIMKLFGVLLASVFVIAIFQLISPVLLVLFGYGIWHYMKKTPNPKKMKLAIVGTVISLFGTFALMTSGGENTASESTVKQALVESTPTKEKTQKELAAEEKAKAESNQEKIVKSATAAITVADVWPSRSNFETAKKAVDKVDQPSKVLQNKLKAVEDKVISEEENIKLAEEAIASAEANLTSESIENAKTYLAVVVTRQKDFSERLANVERTNEEQAAQAEADRVAAEQAEADRIATEQAAAAQAEADRIAAEQAAAAQAEADRVAAEQATAQTFAQTTAAQPVGQTVYIAPDSGTKYHFDSSCRGLSNANSIVSMTLSDAQAQGYTLCGWED
ncbi:MAG: hypothetical protein WAX04_08485 [Oscillospiraceae bacterium]